MMKKIIFAFIKNRINISLHQNFGIYNIKINDTASLNFKAPEILSTLDNKLDILSFDSGIGFLVASIKSSDNIILGRCTHDHSNYFHELCYSNVPMITCGRNHCLVYGILQGDETPSLTTIGNNMFGQCANEIICHEKRQSSIGINNNILQIACGLDHSIVVTDSNKVLTCGLGADGQTGLAYLGNVSQFTEVKFEDHTTKIIKVSSRADTVLAITSSNEVYGWGNNEYGQMFGHSSVLQQEIPVKFNFSGIGTIVDVLAIGSMCFVTTDTDQIYGWGFGAINGEKSEWVYPTEVKLISITGESFHSGLSKLCGSVHYGAVMTNCGRLFTIGNYPGSLGSGTSNEIILPRPVKDVACGIDRIFVTFQ